MSALRLGRSSVRFVHSYSGARVSCAPAPISLALRTLQQPHLPASIYTTIRSYADKPAGRPKQHTGRTPARKTKTASKVSGAGKTGAAKTTKSGTRSKATGTAKAKSKVKAKSKPKPKTPEQIARKSAKEQAEKIRELKQKSLKSDAPQLKGRGTAWHVFHTEKVRDLPKMNGIQGYGQAVKDIAAAYKSLTPNEREHYNHVANQNKAALDESWHSWLANTPALKIHEANAARRQLTKLGIAGYASQIKDPRAVKQPRTSYTMFVTDRLTSGDFKGVKQSEAMKLAAQEWKEVPASEKQRYSELAARDSERYVKEFTEVYGEAPEMAKKSQKVEA